MRADTRMDDGNGEEGFAEQHVFEAGAKGEAKIEAEKSSKHRVKQPLILLWNRYQASILANNQNFSKLLFIKARHFLQMTLSYKTLMIIIFRKLQAICGLASLPG